MLVTTTCFNFNNLFNKGCTNVVNVCLEKKDDFCQGQGESLSLSLLSLSCVGLFSVFVPSVFELCSLIWSVSCCSLSQSSLPRLVYSLHLTQFKELCSPEPCSTQLCSAQLSSAQFCSAHWSSALLNPIQPSILQTCFDFSATA